MLSYLSKSTRDHKRLVIPDGLSGDCTAADLDSIGYQRDQLNVTVSRALFRVERFAQLLTWWDRKAIFHS